MFVFSETFHSIMSFLAGFAIKMQEGEYDAQPKEEPKVCVVWNLRWNFIDWVATPSPPLFLLDVLKNSLLFWLAIINERKRNC